MSCFCLRLWAPTVASLSVTQGWEVSHHWEESRGLTTCGTLPLALTWGWQCVGRLTVALHVTGAGAPAALSVGAHACSRGLISSLSSLGPCFRGLSKRALSLSQEQETVSRRLSSRRWEAKPGSTEQLCSAGHRHTHTLGSLTPHIMGGGAVAPHFSNENTNPRATVGPAPSPVLSTQ